jgi:hypothetical protein
MINYFKQLTTFNFYVAGSALKTKKKGNTFTKKWRGGSFSGPRNYGLVPPRVIHRVLESMGTSNARRLMACRGSCVEADVETSTRGRKRRKGDDRLVPAAPGRGKQRAWRAPHVACGTRRGTGEMRSRGCVLEKEMAVGALLEPALMGEDSGEGLQLVVYRSRGSRC